MTQQIPAHIVELCRSCGYTEPFVQEGLWWAFPPNGVMPCPLVPARPLGLTMPLPPVDFSVIQPIIEQVSRNLEQLSQVNLPIVRQFANNLLATNASRVGNMPIRMPGLQVLVVDDPLGERLGADTPPSPINDAFFNTHAAAARLLETLPLASNSILEGFRPVVAALTVAQAQQLGKQIATAMQALPPEKQEATDDSRKAAIGFLILCHRMKYEIAQLRLTEFCDRHNLTDRAAYSLLREGKIRVKHGVLCCGAGFPHKRKQHSVSQTDFT